MLGAYLWEECGKLTHNFFNLISRLAIEFDVVPFFSTVVQVGCYLMYPFLFNFCEWGKINFFSIKLWVG